MIQNIHIYRLETKIGVDIRLVQVMHKKLIVIATLACLLQPILSNKYSSQSAEVEDDGDAARVRAALRALLSLNDGELKSLMGGEDPKSLAQRISPETQLFLAGTHRKLAKLGKMESLTGDMAIATRRKHRNRKNHHKADSLLGALSELAEQVHLQHNQQPSDNRIENKKNIEESSSMGDTLSLQKKSRHKKSLRTKKMHHHHHKPHNNFHPQIWFRPKGEFYYSTYVKIK